jgi:hypothetical protein
VTALRDRITWPLTAAAALIPARLPCPLCAEIEAVFDMPSADTIFGVELATLGATTDATIGTFFFVDFRVDGSTSIGVDFQLPGGRRQPGGTQVMPIVKQSDTQLKLQIYVDGSVSEYLLRSIQLRRENRATKPDLNP